MIKHRIKLSLCLFFSSTCLLLNSTYSQSETNATQKWLIDPYKLSLAKSVTVYMRLGKNKTANEAGFKEASCEYKTEKDNDIRSMAFMLATADIQTDTSVYAKTDYALSDKTVWSKRYVVYFIFKDGTELKYITGSEGSGYLITDQPSKVTPVTAYLGTYWNIGFWLLHADDPIPPSIEGMNLITCKDEISKQVLQKHYEADQDD